MPVTVTAIRTSHIRLPTSLALDMGRMSWATASCAGSGRLDILDRIGGGDSFASGLIHGYLAGHPSEVAVEYGAAHGVLPMTTPGDSSMATLAEVEALMVGSGGRIRR